MSSNICGYLLKARERTRLSLRKVLFCHCFSLKSPVLSGLMFSTQSRSVRTCRKASKNILKRLVFRNQISRFSFSWFQRLPTRSLSNCRDGTFPKCYHDAPRLLPYTSWTGASRSSRCAQPTPGLPWNVPLDCHQQTVSGQCQDPGAPAETSNLNDSKFKIPDLWIADAEKTVWVPETNLLNFGFLRFLIFRFPF